MNTSPTIAIIGGGIAGLTFARCLPPGKFDVHIFEQKDSFGEIGAAISVFPNALCVLEQLGLLNEILSNSGQFTHVYLKTAKGKILAKTTPKSDYPVICMHRADLHRILLKDIPAHLHAGFALQKLQQQENKKIKLTFANGHEREFDCVIGADGVHSIVRQQILNDGKPAYRGYNAWRGVVKTSFDIGYGSETWGNGKRVGIVPIRDGWYGWWATVNEDYMQSDEPETSKNKLKRIFGDWHFPIANLIEQTDLILKNPIVDRVPVRGWTKGNLTLLGDAAHPTTPNLGQGGCLAIEGAWLLAKCFARYGITPQAFQRYEDLQFPRARKIIKESLRLGKLGQTTNPLLIGFRNLAFRLTPPRLAMKLMDKHFSYRVTKVEI